ncbi:MAG: aminotransferase class III-fold pyridoxal phosphate-dependent enzyme [Pelolinea sp.]|nr:aminotransferase class III-fold pyridoxal phosphate-dependent enzyme [Pelolinea sp.]
MEYQEIIDRKKKIVTSAIKAIPDPIIADVKKRYAQKCKRSVQYFERAKQVIPAGLEHNLGLLHPYPLTMKTASKASIWDIDENEYVDYMMAGGPIILGHKFPQLDEKVIALIENYGPSTGLTCESEILCAEEIAKHMPSVEMVRFLASGTEADMLAVRVARAYTGKKKIIKIAGSYHGWSDQFLLSSDYPGTGNAHASGIPQDSYAHTIELMPNDFEGLYRLFEENRDKDGIAAIIAEPTGGHAGTFPNHPDWNKTLRKVCDEFGALLIFDEVITGFRLALGGGQEYYNVLPDITILGKIITHGYPSCGAVAGSREIMSVCHPGGTHGKKAFTGGTLSANPISTTAGYYSIKYIEEYGAIDKASDYGDRITNKLNELFATRKDLPFFAYNIRSIIHVETACPSGAFLVSKDIDSQLAEQKRRAKAAEDIYMALLDQGVLMLGDCKRMYTCMQHDDASLKKTLNAWENVLSMIPVEG